MARDEKLIYEKPVIIPLGGVEKIFGDSPHCTPGTNPGPAHAEGHCSPGIGAHSVQQPGCYDGSAATSGGLFGCADGTSPSPEG